MPSVNLLIKPASSLCNMRCKYCFYADVSENRAFRSFGMMSEETLELTVKAAFEYASGFAGFAFQGGEPMLAGLDFYKKLITLQEKYNTKKIKVFNSIQTNGTLVNEEWAEFFARHSFLVGLSIDGTRETHNALRVDAGGNGTYEKASAAAEILMRHGADFNILCVVNNFVARYPQKVYRELKKYRYLQFIPCLDGFDGEKHAFSLTEDRYGMFLKQIFDLYYADFMKNDYVSIRNFDNYIQMMRGRPPEACAMNGYCTCYFVIEGDGSVYPCDFYVLDEWRLGNVKNESFREMISSDTAKQFVDGSKYISEECRNCLYYALCRGGCRRDREPFVQGNPGINKHCKSYKAFFEYSLPKMKQIVRRLG